MILDGRDAAAIAQAAEALREGRLVGLPTETVYGLAADAGQDEAVRAIFALKGRPADHPLIVHVADAQGVPAFAADVPAFAQRLIDAFWPGPLTLILPRREGVAAVAAGGQATIGLRCPSHPVARALLAACQARGVYGLAAPSANRFGRVSPTTAAHVRDEFGAGLLVLDGGACPVGIESAIVDCSRGAPVLLRPGVLTRESIAEAAGQALAEPDALGAAPRASGTLEAHYAPRATVRQMTGQALASALSVLAETGLAPAVGGEPVIAVWARSDVRLRAQGVLLRRMPADPSEAARALFATLRDFDAQGVRLIWVETPPDDSAWEGVRDRLTRACAAG